MTICTKLLIPTVRLNEFSHSVEGFNLVELSHPFNLLVSVSMLGVDVISTITTVYLFQRAMSSIMYIIFLDTIMSIDFLYNFIHSAHNKLLSPRKAPTSPENSPQSHPSPILIC